MTGTSWTIFNTGLPQYSGSYPYFTSVVSDNAGNLYSGSRKYGLQQSGAYFYNGTTWTTIITGLTNKEINCMAISSGNVAYAGTNGGGVFSYNGSSWSSVNTGLSSLKVYCLTFDTNGDLYAGTYSGVFKLPSGSTTWSSVGTGLPAKPVISLAFDPSSAGRIFAGLGFPVDEAGNLFGDVYVSSNYGVNWSSSFLNVTTTGIQAMCISPSGNIFTSGNGVYRSTNSGASWSSVNMGLNFSPSMIASSGIAISSQKDIFIASERGIFKSSDDGNSWTHCLNGFVTSIITEIACNTSTGTIFAAGVSEYGIPFNDGAKAYRSTDNGATWNVMPISADDKYHDFAFSSGKVYLAHGFGTTPPSPIPGSILSVSANDGLTWTDLNLSGQGAGFSVDLNSSGHIFAGTETGAICRSTDGGNSWLTKLTPNGNCAPVRVAPNGDIFAGDQMPYPVYYSTSANNGNPFVNMNNSNWPQYKYLNDVVFDSNGNAYLSLSPPFGYHGVFTLTQPWSASSVFQTLDPIFWSQTVKKMAWHPCGYLYCLGVGTMIASDNPLTAASGSCSLPVELISFDAEFLNEIVKTSWSTASEKNCDYFTMERSIDGITFEAIGKVKGAGNSSSIRNYEFVDADFPLAINHQPLANVYYRLKQTDFDGSFYFSKIISVSISESNTVSVFPNPFSYFTTLRISSSVKQHNTELKIFDVFGKEVRKIPKINSFEIIIERGNLPDGIYFIQLKTDKEQFTKKLIIQH